MLANTEMPLAQSSRFHQRMGLADSLALFQALESPPATPFSFGWFLYSLAEAALTSVAILDERVVLATLEPVQDGFQLNYGRLLTHYKAGVFPLMTFSHHDGGETRHVHISENVDEAVAREEKEACKVKAYIPERLEKWKECWGR